MPYGTLWNERVKSGSYRNESSVVGIYPVLEHSKGLTCSDANLHSIGD